LDFLKRGHPADEALLIDSLWRSSPYNHHIISENGTWRAIVYLKSYQAQDLTQFIKNISEICPKQECRAVGSLISFSEFNDKVPTTLFSSLGLSLLLISIIILFISMNLPTKEKIQAILSSVWGSLALLSIFIVLDIPLLFVTSMCGSLLVGLAGDNVIQFIFANKSLKKGIQDLAVPGFIVTISMILLTMVFFLSDLASLSDLGGYICLGFLLGYLGDVWILKGLMSHE
jgi:hypothetical protein